jgi:hypothetical protein
MAIQSMFGSLSALFSAVCVAMRSWGYRPVCACQVPTGAFSYTSAGPERECSGQGLGDLT